MKGLTKTSATYGVPVFQNVHEMAQGGFKLDTSVLPADAYVEPGMPLGYDEATRVAKVVVLGVVNAAALSSATEIQLKKGHLFQVGDYIAKTAGGAAYAITDIDTTEDDYDTITVGTTLGVALSEGDVLFQSSATGASAAAYSVSAKGLNYQTVKIESGADVAAVIRGSVYARRVKGGLTSAVKTLLPLIVFSESK